jgi:hypothetical protein
MNSAEDDSSGTKFKHRPKLQSLVVQATTGIGRESELAESRAGARNRRSELTSAESSSAATDRCSRVTDTMRR